MRALPALDNLKLDADEAIALSILKSALVEPLRIIAENSGQDGPVVLAQVSRNPSTNFGYDAAAGDYADMLERGIVDPAKVARVALENAASVAGMILTTESLITEAEEEPEDHGHGHDHDHGF